MHIEDDEMQAVVNSLIQNCREVMHAAARPGNQPGLYKAWKETRSPRVPIDRDPIVYIELLAVRIKDTIACATRDLKTGKLKPESEEAGAYEVWLATFADLIYIANMLTSEHPVIVDAMKPLRDDPHLAHLLYDLSQYLDERATLIWTHPEAPELCDAAKEKRGLKTSRDSNH